MLAILHLSPAMKTTETILQELAAAIQDLPYISETDAFWETITWPGSVAPTPATILAWHNTPDMPIRLDDFVRMFRAPTTAHEGLSESGLQRVRRYRHLVSLLQENLADIAIFRIGGVEQTVYVLGRTAQGVWLGLKTHASET